MKMQILVALALLLSVVSAEAWTTYGPVYKDSQLPVPVWGDRQNQYDGCPRLSEYMGPIPMGMGLWAMEPTSKFRWKKGGVGGPYTTGGDGKTTVRFKKMNDSGVLATTAYTIYGDGLRDADMVINTDWKWNCIGRPMGSEFDLQSVAAHEAGHMLGLGHSDIRASVMWPDLMPRETKHALALDDKRGVSKRYPKDGR